MQTGAPRRIQATRQRCSRPIHDLTPGQKVHVNLAKTLRLSWLEAMALQMSTNSMCFSRSRFCPTMATERFSRALQESCESRRTYPGTLRAGSRSTKVELTFQPMPRGSRNCDAIRAQWCGVLPSLFGTDCVSKLPVARCKCICSKAYAGVSVQRSVIRQVAKLSNPWDSPRIRLATVIGAITWGGKGVVSKKGARGSMLVLCV
jgi:hypothetical protein